MNVLLTCPRDLLFLLGVTVESRPGRRDPMSAVVAAAHELGGPVTHRKGRLAIVLADPVDAVLALRSLQRALPEYEIRVVSIIASATALELVAGDAGPVRVAWQWMVDDMAPLREDPMADSSRGLCAIGRFRQRVAWRELAPRSSLLRLPCPAAIADQQVPANGLVLWACHATESIRQIETTFVIEHLVFDRTDEGDWVVRDPHAKGFYVNDQFGGEAHALQAGMVVHFGGVEEPDAQAFVVLSTNP